MANTFQDYTATAGQTDFAFTFDYLEDEHVTVEINGVVQLASANSIIVESNGDTKVRLNVVVFGFNCLYFAAFIFCSINRSLSRTITIL